MTNKATAYDPVAKALHWLIFVLLAAQFAIAWTMPEIHRGTEPVGLVGWHLSLGVLIMLLIFIRLLWRLVRGAPAYSQSMPKWMNVTSSLLHILLYAVLVALPPLGWANASSRGWNVSLFDTLSLPALFEKGSKLGHACGDIHSTLAIVLLVLVGAHVAAALYHRLVLKDQVLQRMLP